jgi:hypothetical protein
VRDHALAVRARRGVGNRQLGHEELDVPDRMRARAACRSMC